MIIAIEVIVLSRSAYLPPRHPCGAADYSASQMVCHKVGANYYGTRSLGGLRKPINVVASATKNDETTYCPFLVFPGK
jgi:hypothetical protein